MKPFRESPWLEPITVRIHQTESGLSHEIRNPRPKMRGLELVIHCPNESFAKSELKKRLEHLASFLESEQQQLNRLDEKDPARRAKEKHVRSLQESLRIVGSHADALRSVSTLRGLLSQLNQQTSQHRLDLITLLEQMDTEQHGRERPGRIGDPTGPFALEKSRRAFDSLEKAARGLPFESKSTRSRKEQLLEKILLFKDPIVFEYRPLLDSANEETHLVFKMDRFERKTDPRRAELLRDHFVALLRAFGFHVR